MSASTPAPTPDPPGSSTASKVLEKTKAVKGSTLIVGLNLLVFLVVAGNYLAARHNKSEDKRHRNEAMVVRDVARSAQVWTPQPDGMRLEVRAVSANDTKTLEVIRRSLAFQRTEHLRADYSDVRYGKDDIPGRADLEFGTSHEQLNVRYRDIPNGGELRWITTDSVMLDSLREWAKKVASSPVAW